MRIAFVWYWERASEIYPFWRDGLRAALEEIEKQGHHVEYIMNKDVPLANGYDIILFWDDSNSGFFKHIDSYSAKKGIILTTDPHNIDNLRKLDVVFCESEPVYDAVRMHGIRAVRAFGTDTNFYTPDETMKKDIEVFYPATFSPWKKQSNIAYLGEKLLCVGTVQPDGEGELAVCKRKGVNIEIGYFPAEKIRDYYRRSQNVLIPAIHGSERTVLESMSTDIVPKVTSPQNKRTRSYISEFRKSKMKSPREFVLKFYNPEIYAKKILGGFGI